MIVEPRLGFTFDCPHCTKAVSGELELFALRRRKKKLACACAGSALSAQIRDNVLSVLYPCALCGKEHEAAFVPDRPLSGALCALECPQSGLPTGFVSTPEQIEYIAGTESERLLSDFILRFLGLDAEAPEKNGSESYTLLTCPCGSQSFCISFCGAKKRITCQRCGQILELDPGIIDR